MGLLVRFNTNAYRNGLRQAGTDIASAFNIRDLDKEPELKQTITSSIRQMIDTQGKSGGITYATRVGRKVKNGRRIVAINGRPLLVKSGTMRDELSRGEGVDFIPAKNGKTIYVTISNIPGKYHQSGTKYMEARPELLPNQQDTEKVTEIVFNRMNRHLASRFK